LITANAPSPAAAARVVALGYGDAVREMVVDAVHATPAQMRSAPAFIPHVSPERGPLWLDSARTAFVGFLSGTDARSAAWGAVEGVAFAARMLLEVCSGTQHGAPTLMTGAFGAERAYPQIVADVLGTEVDLVDDSHLPAMGAAAIAAAAVDGTTRPAPAASRISPRPGRQQIVDDRWQLFRDTWQRLVCRPFPTSGTSRSESSKTYT
jgi:xylulokinase